MANDTNTSKLHFSLVSPERELFSGEVDQVVVPGSDGQFGALVNHAPLMSVVKSGVIKIITGNQETKMYVGGGIVDVSGKGVAILAEDAVDLNSIDKASFEKDLKNAQEDLRDAKNDADKAKASKSIERLEAILAAA
ncbi:MAG: F0F1 ATP synthase subunit epsilon [Caulobacterales bacterium]|nr:F0F1 ATP synthase subunit epsilon [Caulobacterales bacterium]MCA0372516.1 F0F1 ATP synthase subunit epsilon [Pseudomonadota bacterium]